MTAARAVVLALLLLLAGCRMELTPPAAGPGERNLGLTAIRSPATATGGTLRVVAGAIDSFDPSRSYQYGMWNLMRLYTRQLVTFAPKPGAAGEQVVPDLATALGKVSDSGRTWTYTLREGVKFENGQPITSAEVKYGIERAFAAATLPGGPGWLVDLLDDPKDPYPGPYRDKDLHKNGLAAITTPNPTTVVFHLNRPFADFDEVLALPDASPALPKLDTGAAYGAKPVSSGPYRFASAYRAPAPSATPSPAASSSAAASGGDGVAGDGTTGDGAPAITVTLVRNPAWDRRTDPVRAALPDRVEVTVGLSPAERDARLLDGRADIDITGSGLQPESVARVLRERDLAERSDNPVTSSVRLLALPQTVAPMNNAHCRAAVQYAVDKAAIKDGLGGDYGAALATSIWPRTVPGYPATDPYPSGSGNHGDLARARAELKACGHADGFRTRIATANSGRSMRIAQEVSGALARVGIITEIRPFPEALFLTSGAGAPKAITDGGYGIVVVNWSADFPSPAAFLPPLLDGRNDATLGNTNYAQITDMGVARLCDAAEAETDHAGAADLWRQVTAVAMDQAGYVPVVEDKVFLFAGARLHNVYVQGVWGNYDLVSVGVA